MEYQFEDSFKQDLQNMEHRLTEMEEKINSIDTKLTQVVDAILGNPLTKAGGFIQDIHEIKKEMENLKKQVDSHEDFKKKFYWTVTIIASAFLLVQYLINIFSTVKH